MKRKILVIVLAVSMVLSLALPAFAAESASATNMKLDSFSGTVTTKNASGKSMTTRKDMRLYNGYTITTGKNSNAFISLDDTKAVKLDSFTTVSIKKNGKKLELQVVSGSLFFNVTEPLKGDEKLNIRTTTMVTGIRGTSGVASVKPAEIELASDGTAVTKNIWDESVQLFTGKAVIEAVVSSSVNSVVSTAEGSDAIEDDSILSLIFGGSKTEPAEITAEETVQVVISAGETVVSRTVSKDEEVEEYEVVKLGTKPADVPSVALEEIAKDEELKSEIEEQAPQILYEDVEQQLEEVVQTEESKEEAKAEKVEEDLKQDEEKTEEIVDQMFEEEKEEEYYEPAPAPVDPAPSDPDPVDPVEPSVTLTNPTAAEYLDALNNPDITSITLENADITITEADLNGNSVDIPAGKTVTLASGSVTVNSSLPMVVSGTLNVAEGASFTAGDLSILSTESVHVYGALTVNGALAVGDDENAGLLEVASTGVLTVAHNRDYEHELELYIRNGRFALNGALKSSDESTYHNLYIYPDAAATFAQGASVNIGHGTANDDVDSTIFVQGSLDTSCGLDSETSIVNYGTTTFNNGYVGTITNRGVNDQEKTAGSLTIKNGNVDIIWNEDGATTIQAGGTVAHVANNGGTYTISGGEIGFATNRSEMTIAGGAIKGDLENEDNPNAIMNYGQLIVSGNTEVYMPIAIRNTDEEDKGTSGSALITGQITYMNTTDSSCLFDNYNESLDNIEFGDNAKLIVPAVTDQEGKPSTTQRFVNNGSYLDTSGSNILFYINNDAHYVETVENGMLMIDFSKTTEDYITPSGTLNNPSLADYLAALMTEEDITITNANLMINQDNYSNAVSELGYTNISIPLDIIAGKTVTLQSGTMTLSGSNIGMRVLGTLNVERGAELAVTGGAWIESQAENAINISGTLTANGDVWIGNADGTVPGTMTIAAGGILNIANNNFIEVYSGSTLNIAQGAKVELAANVEDPSDIWIGINVNDGANLRTAGTFASEAAINNYGNTVIENGYITYVYNYESGNVTMGGCVVDKLSNNGQAVATINGGEFTEIYNESTAALHVNGPIVHVQTPDSNYLFTSMEQLEGVDFSSSASIIASVYEQEREPDVREYKQAFFFDNDKETISFFHENVIITTRNGNKYYAEPVGNNLYKMDFSKDESYYLTANY